MDDEQGFLWAFGRKIPKSQLARIPLDMDPPPGSTGDMYDDDFWFWTMFRKRHWTEANRRAFPPTARRSGTGAPMTRRVVLLSMAGTAIAPTWTEQCVVAEALRSETFKMAYAPIPGSAERVLDSVTLPGRTFRRIPGTDRFRLAPL
jgi:hypothetical protein